MKKSNYDSLNPKLQNGSKNPCDSLPKEFTPNGAEWRGYDDSEEGSADI